MTAAVEAPAAKPRAPRGESNRSYSQLNSGAKKLLLGSTVTLFALMLMMAFIAPLGYMATTSLKSSGEISDVNRPFLPKSPATATVDGKEVPILAVPLPDGTRELALVKPGRQSSVFVDPSDPGTKITWEGKYRTLKPAYHLDLHTDNFSKVWRDLKIPLLLRNTFAIAILGMIGTVISSTLVAYGLSRFRIPFAKTILASLVAAIILPRFLLITPMYAAYQHLGLVGTWVPLIAPHFFANAYNVFLLRQFFLTIPKEMDEAAAIDGAGPMKTLLQVIVPQAKPAIITIAILHFLFAWNDFLEPLVYLSGHNDLLPFSVGLFQALGLYSVQLGNLQAGAFLGMVIPIVIFLVTQRIFLKGIDLSGSSK